MQLSTVSFRFILLCLFSLPMVSSAQAGNAMPLYQAVQNVAEYFPEDNPPLFAGHTGEMLQNLAENTQQGDGSADDAKRCMMVCIRWGEDCVVNPDTGKRRCRRVCQEFGEQCF